MKKLAQIFNKICASRHLIPRSMPHNALALDVDALLDSVERMACSRKLSIDTEFHIWYSLWKAKSRPGQSRGSVKGSLMHERLVHVISSRLEEIVCRPDAFELHAVLLCVVRDCIMDAPEHECAFFHEQNGLAILMRSYATSSRLLRPPTLFIICDLLSSSESGATETYRRVILRSCAHDGFLHSVISSWHDDANHALAGAETLSPDPLPVARSGLHDAIYAMISIVGLDAIDSSLVSWKHRQIFEEIKTYPTTLKHGIVRQIQANLGHAIVPNDRRILTSTIACLEEQINASEARIAVLKNEEERDLASFLHEFTSPTTAGFG